MDNQWNLTIKAGETLRESFMLKEEETKAAINLTGATAICQLRKTAKATEVLATPKITILDAVNGEAQVELSADITSAFPTSGVSCNQEDVWWWDAFITSAYGSRDCLWDGEFKVRPRVTR